jgi:hypothetical protein
MGGIQFLCFVIQWPQVDNLKDNFVGVIVVVENILNTGLLSFILLMTIIPNLFS